MVGTGWPRTVSVDKLNRGSVARSGAPTSGFKIDQDHVAGLLAARKRQLLAVKREVEPKNPLGSKVCQLFWRPATYRLLPEVRNAASGDHVDDGGAVLSPR